MPLPILVGLAAGRLGAIPAQAWLWQATDVGEDLARYRVAAEAGDVDAILELVASDAELVSPISGRLVFRGRADLRVLFVALYGTVKGIRWTHELGDDVVRVLIGDARVGPLRLTDAMVVELAPDGRIQRFRPHLRPWLALTLLALILGPKVARHPGVVRRALAAGVTTPPQHT